MLIDDFLSKIFEISPIVFSLFVVLFAMLFVRIRKKTPIQLSTSKTDASQMKKNSLRDKKEPWYAKHTLSKQTKPINKKIVEKVSASDKGPHVEVIRIHGHEDKNNKTEHISDKKEPSKVIPLNKNNSYEWFHGTDIMKYKIDKLTGDVDEKPADKWFVGEDNIRFKVDKKVIDKKLKKKCNKNAS